MKNFKKPNFWYIHIIKEVETREVKALVIKKNEKTEILTENIIKKTIEMLKKERRQKIIIFGWEVTAVFAWIIENVEEFEKKGMFIDKFIEARGEIMMLELKIEEKKVKILGICNFTGKNKGEITRYIKDAKEKKRGEEKDEKKKTKYDEILKLIRPDWENEEKKNLEINFFSEGSGAKIIKNYKDIKKSNDIEQVCNEEISGLEKEVQLVEKTLSIILKNWYIRSSIAGVSKKIFLEIFNNFNVEFLTRKETYQEIKDSFIGGRCEVIGNPKKGEEILYFDFPSMYGHIMLEKFAWGKPRIEETVEIKKPGLYWVEVLSENMNIPVLPHKKESEKEWEQEIMYTNGRFEGIFSREELGLFIKMGGQVLKIKKGLVFDREERLFKNFAENIIELKNIDKRGESIWKRIIVSLYGRLGMKEIGTNTMIIKEEEYEKKYQEYEIVREVWIGKVCLAETRKNKSKDEEKFVNSNILYASLIASKARVRLYKNMLEVKKRDGRLLYWDTDCYYIATKKAEEIMNSWTGEIFWDPKNKETRVEDAVFASIKNYSILRKNEWKTKIAGTERNQIDFASFKKEFYSNWRQEYWLNNEERDIKKFNKWRGKIYIDAKRYKKRKFSRDKKDTYPFYKIGNEYIEDKPKE